MRAILILLLLTGCSTGTLVSVNGDPRLPPGGFIEHCNRNPAVPECSR